MTGKFYIDNVDAYEAYGICMTEGSYKSLMTWPALKAVAFNDWHENDGIEPDLSNPVLDTRVISLNFSTSGGREKFKEFMELLGTASCTDAEKNTTTAYHDFYIEELGRHWKLRMTAHPSLAVAGNLHVLTVSFADDFPLHDYEYVMPESTVNPSDECLLDGRKLTDYGVRILEGTLSGLMKQPSVKPNLLRNIKSLPGAIYDDGGEVILQSMDTTLNCLLRAGSTTEVWRNYDALLYDLIRPGKRTLSVRASGKEYLCFYKSSSVSEFAALGKIWLKFSITICIL
ncbi:MAG: hypothetical protein NC308_09670 [Clostridium sp.]|nr:hypothetical protein [Bacteroides sp.]MCM1199145.1 hypothetical protein [Clostridium sp.]